MKFYINHNISKQLLFLFIINIIACKDRATSLQGNENKEIAIQQKNGVAETPVEKTDSPNSTQSSSRHSDTTALNSSIIQEIKNELKVIPGPKGFVIRNKTILRVEPNKSATPLETLKEGDIIYLLETAPVDERGYPTWFKVQSANNKTGWLVASSVSFGH